MIPKLRDGAPQMGCSKRAVQFLSIQFGHHSSRVSLKNNLVPVILYSHPHSFFERTCFSRFRYVKPLQLKRRAINHHAM
ncbi:hypothetical protein V6N11_082112 [Hibiscus sabdariffa]|uniref:Uncharacterized protein n=1 Tax=Hibiscus sabdariffa TaxID=183260 RepID=A0ABR2QH45_9ROSI